MITNTGHLAFNVRDMDRMLRFYCDTLGMKKKFTLKYGDIEGFIRSKIEEDVARKDELQNEIRKFEAIREVPWLVYLELAERQYIELFNPLGEKAPAPNVAACYGFQKVSLEVEDAAAAFAELVEKGVTPDSEVHMTADFAYAFNLTDPEGNHIEIVQYTALSPQVFVD